MGIFNRRLADVEAAWTAALPDHFEAVGEAIAVADTGRTLESCWVVGRDLADRGMALADSLDELCVTTQLVAGRDPSFAEAKALSVAWSEATLGYMHGLSCSDPLTGLSTMAHLRERIAGIFRDVRRPVSDFALVVVELASLAPGDQLDQIAAAGRLSVVGHTARSVFAGSESVCRIGKSRVVVVAERDRDLGRRVSLLRRMLVEGHARVWIEGLPSSESSAAHLLDELARGA